MDGGQAGSREAAKIAKFCRRRFRLRVLRGFARRRFARSVPHAEGHRFAQFPTTNYDPQHHTRRVWDVKQRCCREFSF